MFNLNNALDMFQDIKTFIPYGHVEVQHEGEGNDIVYHWASYYGNSVKPTDDDWCYSWDELVNDLNRFDIDADMEVWELCEE